MPLHSLRAPSSFKLEVRYDAFGIPLQTTLVYLDGDGEEITHLTAELDDRLLIEHLRQARDILDFQPSLL